MATIGTSYNVSPNPNDAPGAAALPVGAITMWSTPTSPSGWLLCDGSAVSRNLYAHLFSVIGTTFGTGDGSTTFNVPNASGRGVRGFGTAPFNVFGAIGGNDGFTLAANQLPNHAHTYTEPNSGTGHKHSASQGGGPFNIVSSTGGIQLQGYTENVSGPDTGFSTTGITINDSLTLGGVQQTQQQVNLINRFLTLQFIIKAA